MNNQTYAQCNFQPDTIHLTKRGVVWRAVRHIATSEFPPMGYGVTPQQAIEALWLEEAIDLPDPQEERPIPENLQQWLNDGGAKSIHD
jgi:hypothetical protein